MTFALGSIGQIALPVADVDRAERFFEGILGLRKLYRFGDLVFFDCAGCG
jgi:methylmalonyl-CoA/ethylmalonyl-CoA epimerase